MEMKFIEDDSEGHIFEVGDKLNIESENAVMTIKEKVVQIKDGKKYKGYWVMVKKLDGSFSGIRTVNENWIKDFVKIN